MDFPQFDKIEYVYNNSFMFQWCCKCGSRHVWHFHIERGKTPADDYVELCVGRDPVAEKLRKFYEKEERKERNHGNKTKRNLSKSVRR